MLDSSGALFEGVPNPFDGMKFHVFLMEVSILIVLLELEMDGG